MAASEPTLPDDPPPAPGRAALREATLRIHGVGCHLCTAYIRTALLALPGVIAAEVDHDEARATVLYDAARVEPASFVRTVVSVGADRHQRYGAEVVRVRGPADTATPPA